MLAGVFQYYRWADGNRSDLRRGMESLSRVQREVVGFTGRLLSDRGVAAFRTLGQVRAASSCFFGLFDSPAPRLAQVVGRLITRRQQKDDPVEIHQARAVTRQLSQPDTHQLDGDPAGSFTTMQLDIAPSALLVRVPS